MNYIEVLPGYNYLTLHNKVYRWIDEGLFKFKGDRHLHRYTELDQFLFSLFEVPFNFHPAPEWTFNEAIMTNKINCDWINSDNALTLFKALVIRKGLG